MRPSVPLLGAILTLVALLVGGIELLARAPRLGQCADQRRLLWGTDHPIRTI